MNRTLAASLSFALCAVASCSRSDRAVGPAILQATLVPNPKSAAELGLSIPAAHPRIWWTPARIAAARTWWNGGHAFEPRHALEHAFAYVMTGGEGHCRSAIDWALTVDLTVPDDKNDARWKAADVIFIYDWCHGLLSEADKATLLARWNEDLEGFAGDDWGGPGMELNNFYWSHLRNELLWGAATHGENPKAEAFLHHALVTRWEDSFKPFAQTDGRGGVLAEGTFYGYEVLGPAVTTLVAAEALGRDLLKETDFFRELVYALVHATTPAPTTTRLATGVRNLGFELFPFADDEGFMNGGSAGSAEAIHAYGNFMRLVSHRYAGTPTAVHARSWLELVKPNVDPFFDSLYPATGSGGDFSALPPDHVASGQGYVWSRTAWGPDATTLFLQMIEGKGADHTHHDAGSFQLWRRGQWLSRETFGYATDIVGHAQHGEVEIKGVHAHNGILFGGIGMATQGARDSARVLRLESQPDYVYAAVDATDRYRGIRYEEDYENPHVERVIREFLFVKPLEALVVFDRLQSNDPSVTKTFLMHFETEPVRASSDTLVATLDDQQVRLVTLLPPPGTPEVRVFHELDRGDGSWLELDNLRYGAQHRAEISVSGALEHHLLHVVQGKDLGGADLAASVTDDGSRYVVTLTHPSKGTAQLVLERGIASIGGAFGYAASGAPTPAPLSEAVATVTLTDAGPTWSPGTVRAGISR